MPFKIGNIVHHHEESLVLYEIVFIRWACPPDTGGTADLRFWGPIPNMGIG